MSVTVFDLDDLCDDFDPWDALHMFKEMYPNLKVTLFAIPGRCSEELLERYRALDWVELGVHGYHHSTMECAIWTYEETAEKLSEIDEWWPGSKVFKAPGWMLNEQVVSALFDLGWTLADHTAYMWNSLNLPVKRYTYNLPSSSLASIHGHTWNCMGNGPEDWPRMFDGVDSDAEFAFVSEVAKELNLEYTYHKEQDDYSSWSSQSVWGKRAASRLQQMVDACNPECVADFGGNDGFALSCVDVPIRWNVDGDPSRVHHSASKYGIWSACVNLENLPFEDNSFEWGFTSHTLEHVQDLEKSWDEIKRVCKKGCWVVVPVESEEEFNLNPAHLHRHTHQEWIDLLGIEEVERNKDEIIGVWRR